MLSEVFSSLLDAAQKSFCRFPLVLSGEKAWCIQTLLSSPIFRTLEKAVYVSKAEPLQNFHTLPASKVKSLLGSDCNLLVWDGFSGLSPDGLGAASGLVRGGGLFIIIVPPFDQLAASPDPDYRRMCADERELAKVNTFFLKRLLHFFNNEDCLLLCQDKTAESPVLPRRLNSQAPNKGQSLPTADQEAAIESLIHVVEGHRRRPLVITADRGRGKSSTLGIAAAKLALKYQKLILITAPSKRACAHAFSHFSSTISTEGCKPSDYDHCLQFISPDDLLSSKPSCQLLLIDEAAGIPASVLSELLSHYARVAFSSTIHGYEGNGQGFAIRFRKQLDQLTPNWKGIHLTLPVRWAANDPLEKWISRLLFLSLNDEAFVQATRPTLPAPDIAIIWPSQAQLSSDSQLFESIISLLVNAHYQTSPDDIRLILDHPGISMACAISKSQIENKCDTLVAAMLVMREGGISQAELHHDILAGTRRLRGHLVPQTLATSSGDAQYLEQDSLRIMRIAVKAEYQNQGLGSQLINAAYQFAKSSHLDSLTSAFGLNTELLSFWLKNQFSLLKLGIQRDNASGCYAAIMQRPVSSPAQKQNLAIQEIFTSNFLSGLSRQYRNHHSNTVYDVLKALEVPERAIELDKRQLAQVQRFATQKLAIEECMNELVCLTILGLSQGSSTKQDPSMAKLLIKRVLQAHSVTCCVEEFNLKGKKELDQHLRASVKTLLSERHWL